MEDGLTSYDWTRHVPVKDEALRIHLGLVKQGLGLDGLLSFHPSEVNPSLGKLPSRVPSSILYDEETAMKVHHLTVATLIAFASSLAQLKVAVAKRVEQMQKELGDFEKTFWAMGEAAKTVNKTVEKKLSQESWKMSKKDYYDRIWKSRTRDTCRRGGKRVVRWFGCPNSPGLCAFFGVAPSSEYPNEFGGWYTGNVHYPEQTKIPGFCSAS